MNELSRLGPARVLIVDDDTTVLAALAAILKGRYQVQVARNGQDALRLARLEPPDLVLLDLQMPDLDGCAVCASLKADPITADLPIVFLTGQTDEATEVRVLGLGAADFIGKPLRAAIVQARVANLVRMKRLTDRIRSQTATDGLTGLANRARFDRELQTEWLRSMRHGRDLVVMMVDVDHFKAYNDHYGHLAGDAALRRVAAALGTVVHRTGDLLARYGGEEFVYLLPDTDLAGAGRIARQVMAAIAAAELPHAVSPVAARVTISAGLAALQPAGLGRDLRGTDPAGSAEEPSPGALALLAAADLALYAAKRHGRNQAWLKSPDVAQALPLPAPDLDTE